jgi:hypothetical protein
MMQPGLDGTEECDCTINTRVYITFLLTDELPNMRDPIVAQRLLNALFMDQRFHRVSTVLERLDATPSMNTNAILSRWLEDRTAKYRDIDESKQIPPDDFYAFRTPNAITMLGSIAERLIKSHPLSEGVRCYILRDAATVGDVRILKLIYRGTTAEVDAILLGAAEGTSRRNLIFTN